MSSVSFKGTPTSSTPEGIMMTTTTDNITGQGGGGDGDGADAEGARYDNENENDIARSHIHAQTHRGRPSSPPPDSETPRDSSRQRLFPNTSSSANHGWSSSLTFSDKIRISTLNLTPAWFATTMGTGVVSILLYNLPYNADWLRIIGVIFFVLNLVIFTLLCAGTVARFVCFRGVFLGTLRHPVSSMFWGALSMGLTTIVDMIALATAPAWGRNWAYLAVALFYLNALIALILNIGMLYIIISRHTHTHESFAATLILPIVSAVVVASAGAVVAHPMMSHDPQLARATVIVAYILWGTGTPIAILIIGLWLYRSALFGYPPAGAITAVFLPVGPCGQASFGIAAMGRVIRDLAYDHDTFIAPTLSVQTNLHIADAIYAGGIVTSLIIWGLGLVWYILAIIISFGFHFNKTNRTFFSRPQFSLNYWSLTFPIGVFAMGATELAAQLDSDILKVIGTILSLQVVLSWAWVSYMTVVKAWEGSLFVSPEVASMTGGVPLRFLSVRSAAEKAQGA